MPAITPAQLRDLQANEKNIRNICILAHVDHGKTTLSDSLLATNGIISSKMAGKVRYLDSREDEQQRGITMESSAISLYFKLVKAQGQDAHVTNEYLINLIDSPGHVDFSSEVSTASRLCDGGLVLVDVVEGICTQTIAVLRQAWIDKVKPILVFNKMDRLIVELQMTPMEAYLHVNKILEQANAVMATFFTGDWMEDEAKKVTAHPQKEDDANNNTFDWSTEERDDSDIYFDPARGNVIFASAIDGWAFRIQQFAVIYAKKLGVKDGVLQKCLWGNYYFDPKTKRVLQQKHLKGKSLKPMFVQFVLENIWAVYDSVTQQNRERTEKIVNALGIKVLPRDLRSRDTQTLLSAIFTQWLPLSTCVLLTIVGQLPPPSDAQQLRLPKVLYPDHPQDHQEPSNDIEKALYSCDASDEAPVVAYVSKMFAVPSDLMPENRRKPLTAEEMRERGRQQRLLRQQLKEQGLTMVDDDGGEISSDSIQLDTPANDDGLEDQKTAGEHMIGFARLYSGTLRVGQKVFVLGPKYDRRFPDKHCTEIIVESLYLIMGRELESLEQVSAGNVFGIAGLEGHLLKNGTLTTSLDVGNLATVSSAEAAPILRVALEPEDPTEMDKLVEGLRLLNQADPCVQVMIQETGEHVILTAGELHLERCLKDLRERFARTNIHVSPPIVPFRETIVINPEVPMVKQVTTNDATDAQQQPHTETVPRGSMTLSTAQQAITLQVRTVPLPTNVTEYLTSHANSIKAMVEQKLARRNKGGKDADDDPATLALTEDASLEVTLSPQAFQQGLRDAFAKAQKKGDPFSSLWDDIVDQIWAFGPRRIGANLLVNRIPGYVRSSFFDVGKAAPVSGEGDESAKLAELDINDEVLAVEKEQSSDDPNAVSILDLDFHVHTAFQLTTLYGPLCAEPMSGVCYIVQDVKVNHQAIPDARSRLGLIQGQVITTMREACKQGFLDWSPRLLLAMYKCDIQASAEVLGRVYSVISKRKGKIVSEDLKDGTPFWQIRALLPVVESFGFSDEIRKRTSGAASPQLVFSGFEMLDQDPFWVPTTEEELEDLGDKADRENLAKKYMDTVRKRKGMFVEKKLVEHAEKQRTLKSK
ncbi:P-loop containing nucleoside triphosphate hydrolase protein [Hesseltinella vesiculosa]|uniref:Ribosome assembly protein 1 n=1 Tax=Hesseltinella vesiculosa TaxID=101127 RepID=A0A1X2GVD7_9FUNG|nr:P-loop containing nucleoside triphosphate hydrolase protein [Hesseltinella vesiculosa]